METFLTQCAHIIDLVAVAILVGGFFFTFALAIKKGVGPELSPQQAFRQFRWQLGQVLLLALEILIVSDVIYSILHRTLEEIAILSATVFIRTFLSYFLNLELDHLEKPKD